MASDRAAAHRPADAGRRFERWLELIPYCERAPEGVPLDELAERFDDSESAILADVERLVGREYYLPGSFADSLTILIGADRLELRSPGHFERPIRLSPLEALALQLGLQIVLAETSPAERAGLEEATRRVADALRSVEVDAGPGRTRAGSGPSEVGGAGEAEEAGGLDLDEPLAYGPALPESAARAYGELRRALRDGRVVELRYFKPHEPDEAPPRRVEPWALARAHGEWYLVGRDRDPEEPRVFRLDRILDVEVTDVAATVPSDLRVEDHIDPETVYRGDEDDLEVTIRYSPRIARWIRERYGDDAEPRPDGSVRVRHRCKSPDWPVTRVLRYGADAELIAPPELRARVRRALQDVAE